MATSTTLGLERLRKRKGISLHQIAASTKISTHFLQAIENEEFGKLPGGIFDRNYLRQYAAAAQFDENKLLKQYGLYQQELARREEALQPPAPKRLRALRWLTSVIAPIISLVTPQS